MVVRPRSTPKKHFMGEFLAAGLSGTGIRMGVGAFVSLARGRTSVSVFAEPDRIASYALAATAYLAVKAA